MTRKVDRNLIDVPKNRQREDIKQQPLNELKESILTKGLIHKIAVDPNLEDGRMVLLSGERRLMAIDLIAKENKLFRCDGDEIAPGEVPISFLTDLQEVERKEAEFEENAIRVNYTWQEEAKALAEIHRLRQARNPQQTPTDTAKELLQKSGGEPVLGSAHPRHVAEKVREAVRVAAKLSDPQIANARNATEAHTAVLAQEERAMLAELATRRIAAMGTRPNIEIRHGNALQILPALDEKVYDLILTDIPYGIGADSGGFRSRTVHHHNYSDTLANSKQLAQAILLEGFRICKPRANFFMFCDIRLGWDWLQILAKNIGWSPFETPLIWHKSDSEGLAPWGKSGPRRTYEIFFFATKGEKGLLSSPTDIFRVNRVPRHERIFAAEKPVELMRQLVECSTLPGDLVLDPCCGSGATLVACRETQRKGLGIELDENTYKTAMSNVYKEEKDGNAVVPKVPELHEQGAAAPSAAAQAPASPVRAGAYDQFEEGDGDGGQG